MGFKDARVIIASNFLLDIKKTWLWSPSISIFKYLEEFKIQKLIGLMFDIKLLLYTQFDSQLP
jgi:hypothetical protein